MKTKSILAIITASFFSFRYAFSQAPVKDSDVDFGGSENEQVNVVQQTADGGYITGGFSESGISGDKTQPSQGSADYWIVKTDAKGVKQWDARFGGNSVDQLTALQQTADGGYILGGLSFSGISGDKTQNSQGNSDYWIVKTNASGIKQWDARFGGNDFDELHSLQQTVDGGFILGGFSLSNVNGDQSHLGKGGKDFWMVKTDANGVKQWDQRFGGNKFEEMNSIRQTSDGGYICGGYSLSGVTGNKTSPNIGGYDYWIVKTNPNGVKQWDITFGGIDDDWLTQLRQTMDGGYILGGWSWSGASGDKSQPTQGDNDYWIIKTDANGLKQWDADFGGNSNDYLNPVLQTTDGGYILGGYSSSPVSGDKTAPIQGGTDYWMIKTDANGMKQWDADFGGNDFDFLYGLDQASDGGYILGGYSSSGIGGDKSQPGKGLNDYWIVKTDAAGVTCNAPFNFTTGNITASKAVLKWDAVLGAIKYKVSYKVAGSTQWTTINSAVNHKTVQGLSANTEYNWRVKSICGQQPNSSSDWSVKQSFTTDIMRLETVAVYMNEIYPNPFSQSATLNFSLPEASLLLIEMIDINGKVLKVIAHENFSPGSHQIILNCESMSTGIYFLRLTTDKGMVMKKVVLE